MIITCEQCKTRYNLDEDRIKETGSKVRCSQCGHIFTAYKPVFSQEAELKPETQLPLRDESLKIAPEEAPPTEGPPEGIEEEAKVDKTLRMEVDIPGKEEEPPVEEVPLEEEPILFEEDETLVEDTSLAEEETTEEERGLDETVRLDMGISKEEPEERLMDTISIDSFRKEIAETEEGEAEEEARAKPEEEAAEVVERPKPPKRKISRLAIISLSLVSFLGIAYIAFLFLRGGGIQIPFITGPSETETKDTGNLNITLIGVKGSFVPNTKAGKLYVISGKIRNDYPEPRSFIKLKGTIYSKAGNVVQSRIVYCGNIFSDTELEQLDIAAIRNRMANKFGDKRLNFHVPPNKVVPFMIVFDNLPQNLKEFEVEVVGSVSG